MFVSHNYKLLFFEVPRTGSRSVTLALTTFDPRSPTAVIRAAKRNLHHYHLYDQALVDKHADYSLIAAHRNPYERIRSHYKYRKQYGNPDGVKNFSFEQYVLWACKGELPFEIAPASIDQPICELIPPSEVDHWLSFDNLVSDWQQLSEKLQIDLPNLLHINNSKPELDAHSQYTQELADLVYERFKQDFDHFGYANESWQA